VTILLVVGAQSIPVTLLTCLDKVWIFSHLARKPPAVCQISTLWLDRAIANFEQLALKAMADHRHSRTIGIEKESFRIDDYMNQHQQFDDVLLLTVIRDPIDRAWSDLNYNGTWWCSKPMTDSNHSNLSDLMDCAKQNVFWLSNFYVRMFSGLLPNNYHSEWKRVAEVHLELSLLILRQFDVVIILKEWEAHSRQLRQHGIANTTLPHQNVNAKKSKEVISDEMEQYLRSINRFDLRFFEAAQDIARAKTACSQG